MREPIGASATTPSAAGSKTRIERGLSVIGTLMTDGEIELNGVVQGDICARRVTVGRGAVVTGEIVAEHVAIAGEARGRITARNTKLLAGAHVESDMIYQKLAIEEGAEFEGSALRKPEDDAWAKITETFKIPGVELTDDALNAVKALRTEFEKRGS